MAVLHAVLVALWLMLPAYFANMSAVLVPRIGPIDGGRIHADGKRVLGDGKTWGGLLLGPLLGSGLLFIAWTLTVPVLQDPFGLPSYGPPIVAFAMFYAIGLGALVGDAVESYFKRRRGFERGAAWIPFDQLDFVVGSIAFGLAFGALVGLATGGGNWWTQRWDGIHYVIAIVVTPALHLTVNYVGYKIGKKEVPW